MVTYTRSNDIVGALKYYFQAKYSGDANEDMADAHSVLEVLRVCLPGGMGVEGANVAEFLCNYADSISSGPINPGSR